MKAAVLGSPIAHSLSPALHRAAYAELGLDDWTYEAVECDEAALAAFVTSRGPEWAGLSLTMPLKRTVLPLLAHVDPLAVIAGGANTVVFRPDGRYGYNTDVQGIVDALTEVGAGPARGDGPPRPPAAAGLARGDGPPRPPAGPGGATIIGAGATACSALAALAELGVAAADVAVRDPSRATGLLAAADRLHVPVRLLPLTTLTDVAGLLISTVPAGVADSYAERIRETGRAPAAVLDVVYAPWPTPLAEAASAAGAVVASGFAMLLHQAATQVELMTGKPAPLEAMRAAGEAELARRTAVR